MKKFLLSFIAFTMITQSATSKDIDRNILEKIKVVSVEPSTNDNGFNEKHPIAFSWDRKRFIIGYDRVTKRNKDGFRESSFYKVLLYNPDATKPKQILNFNKSLDTDDDIGGFAYSPDDKMIAIGKENDITLIDASSGKVLQTLPTLPDNYKSNQSLIVIDGHFSASPEGPPSNLHFTPDGTRLIGYAMKAINIWDLKSGKLIKRFGDDEYPHSKSPIPFAMASDGQTFARWSDRNESIKIFNMQNYNMVKILKPDKYCINSLVFSPSADLLASTCGVESIKIWDVESGKMIKELKINGIYKVIYLDRDTIVILDATYNDGDMTLMIKTFSMKDGKVKSVQKLSEYIQEFLPIKDILKQVSVTLK